MKSSKACRRWIRTPERNDRTRHPAEMKEKLKRARDVGNKKHIAKERLLGLFNPCSRCSLLASKATPFLQAGPAPVSRNGSTPQNATTTEQMCCPDVFRELQPPSSRYLVKLSRVFPVESISVSKHTARLCGWKDPGREVWHLHLSRGVPTYPFQLSETTPVLEGTH